MFYGYNVPWPSLGRFMDLIDARFAALEERFPPAPVEPQEALRDQDWGPPVEGLDEPVPLEEPIPSCPICHENGVQLGKKLARSEIYTLLDQASYLAATDYLKRKLK